MLKIIAACLISLSSFAHAQTIAGTLVLKGTLRTKIWIEGVETTCRVKVDKVRNLLQEDSFGNPAYLLDVEIALSGEDSKRKIKIKHEFKVQLINLFLEDQVTRVKDLDYASSAGDVTLLVNQEGRLVFTSFPYGREIIVCKF